MGTRGQRQGPGYTRTCQFAPRPQRSHPAPRVPCPTLPLSHTDPVWTGDIYQRSSSTIIWWHPWLTFNRLSSVFTDKRSLFIASSSQHLSQLHLNWVRETKCPVMQVAAIKSSFHRCLSLSRHQLYHDLITQALHHPAPTGCLSVDVTWLAGQACHWHSLAAPPSSGRWEPQPVVSTEAPYTLYLELTLWEGSPLPGHCGHWQHWSSHYYRSPTWSLTLYKELGVFLTQHSNGFSMAERLRNHTWILPSRLNLGNFKEHIIETERYCISRGWTIQMFPNRGMGHILRVLGRHDHNVCNVSW